MCNINEDIKGAAITQRCVEDLKALDKSMAISSVCCIVDTLADIYKIDTMQLWEEMHKNARVVYDEMGPANGPVRGM